jgi:glycine cleavage system transcriptional repressor
MSKVIISVLGPDRPGIIAAVTRILFQQDCNIENVSQTILQSEFSGIFIAAIPNQITIKDLSEHLNNGLTALSLHVHVKHLETRKNDVPMVESEPFVITTIGPDRKGLVAGITEIIARYSANVTNLEAIFKGGDDPTKNIMIYEVDVPKNIDQQQFHRELRKKAKDLKLEINIQHRRIFEEIHRV